MSKTRSFMNKAFGTAAMAIPKPVRNIGKSLVNAASRISGIKPLGGAGTRNFAPAVATARTARPPSQRR